MLITSRQTGRWVVPKGNLMVGKAPHEAAAIETEEEAGVRGKIRGSGGWFSIHFASAAIRLKSSFSEW